MDPSTPDGKRVAHSYTLYCPPLITSPQIARDFVASVLRTLELDHIVDAARMCTSELVTNAYKHAAPSGSLLWLAHEITRVRVTVYDGTPRLPTLRQAAPDAEGGRGLQLVVTLAERYGTTRGAPLGLSDMDGKGVWFTLATV